MGPPDALSAALAGILSLLRELAVVSSSVPPWLWTLLIALLAAWFNHYLRARGRIREGHHEAIKKDVLAPLLDQLGAQLSILRQKAPPVVTMWEPLPDEEPRPRATGGSPQRHQDVLRITYVLLVPLQARLEGDARLEAPGFAARFFPGDPLLYGCTKAHHLPGLIREFEALEVCVGEYGQRCLPLAEQLQETLRARSPVPTSVLDQPETPTWLNPAKLALYVLNHRLGVDRSPLSLGGGTLSTVGGTVVARAGPDELGACLALVEELLPDDGRAAALLNEARSLTSQVIEVQQKVEDRRRAPYLAGSCRYVPGLSRQMLTRLRSG